MKHLECLLLYSTPASKKRVARLARFAAETKTNVAQQSTPTHIARVHWKIDEFHPLWILLLRANDSATIIECISDDKEDSDVSRIVKRTLLALHIGAKVGTVAIGPSVQRGPYRLEGVFPGDKEFEQLIRDPAFIRYLKDEIDDEEWMDLPPHMWPDVVWERRSYIWPHLAESRARLRAKMAKKTRR